MKQDGLGSLYVAYEELKQKLEKEGLFAIEHKLKIPYMPRVIGVLTSQTGSVIKDIINVSTRRNPNVYIRLLPVPVQGEGAAEKISEAIDLMNAQKLADVIIIARGGGSLEDLWPFNEEIVARSIYNSKIPIISAVGHETDFTIADFVADLRAPTPSAAAELSTSDIFDIKLKLEAYHNRYKVALKKKIEYMKLAFEKCMSRRAYKEPLQKINEYHMILDKYIRAMINGVNTNFSNKKLQAYELISKLDALSPLKTLKRGYSITEHQGKIVTNSKQLKKDDIVNLTFSDGKKQAQVL